MRSFQRRPALRALLALGLGGIIGSPAHAALSVTVDLAIGGLVAIVVYLALTIAPDAIAHWRGHRWRWWWRRSDDEGPFWPGTRIPRGPRPGR